jgi:glutamate formiminotransferase
LPVVLGLLLRLLLGLAELPACGTYVASDLRQLASGQQNHHDHDHDDAEVRAEEVCDHAATVLPSGIGLQAVAPVEDLHECVVNVSEGRDTVVLESLARAAGENLLDLHSDADHHRSVFTVAGRPSDVAEAVRSLARETVRSIDINTHEGAHPRVGALDVVPWVTLAGWPLQDSRLSESIRSRDEFASWAAVELELPCFLYGPERSLPDVRREAWKALRPDLGPPAAHPTAGAAAVGARPVLVAYNVWLADGDPALARSLAARVRGPTVRALGLRLGEQVQVSFNLIAPWLVGPGAVFDFVASRADVVKGELVGLIPEDVLRREPIHRHRELGLEPSSTIEARLEKAGLDVGRFGSHTG